MTANPALECWYLTGPTAAGKTAIGLELARLIGAEIVSLDSMALYRGMDVGTAKPDAAQRAAVPHHLIDCLEPHEDFSLARYLASAKAAIARIRAAGREVLFVGGTPLYLKGLLRGVFRGPPADWPFRKTLLEQSEASGPRRLHERLQAVDPATASRLHPNDTRRVIRALEVYQQTGRPISQLQQQFAVGRSADACRVFVLDWPRDELYARIEQRVDQMFAAGLIDEVRGLLASPRPLGRTAGQAVGYREVLDHLAGRQDLATTIELVKRHTRQLAKRQLTWFRSLSECQFLAVRGQIDPREVARRILATALPSAS